MLNVKSDVVSFVIESGRKMSGNEANASVSVILCSILMEPNKQSLDY